MSESQAPPDFAPWVPHFLQPGRDPARDCVSVAPVMVAAQHLQTEPGEALAWF